MTKDILKIAAVASIIAFMGAVWITAMPWIFAILKHNADLADAWYKTL